ncbi:MAG: MoxR family ATPase [Sulfurimonas sp.]|nr:MoxR family ATPase [Sulfurimonas sp.]
MYPQNAKRSLEYLTQKKVPVFLWGPPGIGKSSIVAQIAKEAEMGFIDLRLSLLDPTDLRGIPFFNTIKETALWAPPSFLPDGKVERGILFLDELNTAAPMVQASAYQLILDRKIGEYTLPDGWAIVAAGNRESDRGVVFRMAAPLANRFVHLEMEVSVEDWKVWALKSEIHPAIIAFISHRPDTLFTFGNGNDSRSFATPRTWQYVNQVLACKPDADLLLPMLAGAIGEDVAASFLGFLSVAGELPDLDAILDGSCKDVPSEAPALHILSAALSMRIDQATSSKKLNNLIEYTLSLPGEFSIMIVQDLRDRKIELDHLQSWTLWMKKFNTLLR